MDCANTTQNQYTRPMHFAITNYTDGERAAAIPTAKGTESDVMVFATEDEQEALTQTDVVSLVRHNDGGGRAKPGKGALCIFLR